MSNWAATGGNLALLSTEIGTRNSLRAAESIVVLEEIGEEIYRVDRMLTQLRRAGWFDGVAGVAVGQFTDCAGEGPTTPDVLAERLGDLGVPVLGGLPIGHGAQQTAVGLGVAAVLDADAGTLVVQPVGTSNSSY